MTEQKRCEDLIDGRLEGRLSDLLNRFDDLTPQGLIDAAKEYDIEVDDVDPEDTGDLIHDVREAHRERSMEGVLSVTKKTMYTVLLSWGGPSDGFDFVYQDGELVECYYFYQDWFDGARRAVAMMDAQCLADLYCVGPDFE